MQRSFSGPHNYSVAYLLFLLLLLTRFSLNLSFNKHVQILAVKTLRVLDFISRNSNEFSNTENVDNFIRVISTEQFLNTVELFGHHTE